MKCDWNIVWKKEKKLMTTFIIAGILAIIGFFLVLFCFIETSPLGGEGEWTFNDWTMNYVFGFIILVILWELLFVGIPALIFFGVSGYMWWNNLSAEKKEEYKCLEKDSKTGNLSKGGCGGSFFFFILVCIVIAIDGNWNTRFAELSYSYFFYACMFGLMWLGIIIGSPALIATLIWYRWKEK